MEINLIGVIFWGSVIVSILAAVYSILSRAWGWMLLSMMFYYPFAWYLHASPRFEGFLFIYVFHLIIAYAVWRKKERAAWASLIPIVAMPLWITFLIVL